MSLSRSHSQQIPQRVLPLNRMARRLGVTCRWLKNEADLGRLPHVRAESRYLFDIEAVENALAARCTDQAQEKSPGETNTEADSTFTPSDPTDAREASDV